LTSAPRARVPAAAPRDARRTEPRRFAAD